VTLAREYYPEFTPLLRKARGVVRGDIGRLLVLHRHGGLYADLDYLCMKPLDGILAGASLALPVWKDGACTNALMASQPGHPLLLDLAKEGLRRWQESPTARPEQLAGPETLERVLRGYAVTKLDPALVCPFDWREHRPRPTDFAAEYPNALCGTPWAHGW
jgi:mannosyltransferase OCH1-like enzyme